MPLDNTSSPYFVFVGVTTGDSSIMRVFPRWMQVLGRPEIQIRGLDHRLHDERERYRETLRRVKNDPLCLGGLVTTHKIDLLESTRDMFDVLDPSAVLTGEVSCLSKRAGQLVGHAKDPLTAGLSLDAVLGADYFKRTGGHVLNFGAGGSGKAIALHLMQKPSASDRPERFVMVNRTQERLDRCRDMVEMFGTDIAFEYVCCADDRRGDEILTDLPEGSVVINSTGMGKDRPGSPISDNGIFPRGGVAWEINYRGELDFMHQALSQTDERDLTVEDGWLYFLHGWTQHIAEVLHIDMDPATFNELSELASDLRPAVPARTEP